ncbi:MAG: histidine phosphatase family protein [Planctomycetota bacterium]
MADDEQSRDFEAAPQETGPRDGRRAGTRVWFARHAQVREDWATRSYGPEDVPLSEEGERRTVELGRSLAACAPAVVWSSDLSRASKLGTLAAEGAAAPLRLDPRLREVDRGAWRGLEVSELHETKRDQMARFYDDPWTYDGHGGESDRAVAIRAWPALLEALDAADDGTLVVTAHYNVLRVLTSVALGIPDRRSFAFRLDKGRSTLLEDTPSGWRLIAHNVFDPGAFEHRDEYLGLRPGNPTH